MWEFIEGAAEDLYRRARLEPAEARGAVDVAVGILGPNCIRLVPGTSLPSRGELVRLSGNWIICVRKSMSAEDMHHAIGHELGHYWVKMNLPGDPREEEIADRIGAAVCAPRDAYLRARREHGSSPSRLGKLFVLGTPAAALRLSECTGTPAALVSPRAVRVRGNEWPWPDEPALRMAAIGGVRLPGVAPTALGRGRVLLKVVA